MIITKYESRYLTFNSIIEISSIHGNVISSKYNFSRIYNIRFKRSSLHTYFKVSMVLIFVTYVYKLITSGLAYSTADYSYVLTIKIRKIDQLKIYNDSQSFATLEWPL